MKEITNDTIEKKLNIQKQNIGYFRKSIPLIEGIDFFCFKTAKRSYYKYSDAGFKKLASRKKRGVKK